MPPEPLTVSSLAGVPGLVHGFGRRAPGASAETREETRARVERLLQPHGVLWLLRQVHGHTVVEPPWPAPPAADAAVSGRRGDLLGIETADCLPVLLVDPVRRAVAAVHAGWRGTAARVTGRAVSALVLRGSRPEELLAALGPAIGACCYEVGDELRPAFGDEAAHVFSAGPNGRPHLDLAAANRRQLLAAGVPAAAITSVLECTRCRPELYHSYRREGRGGGRMISYVGFSR
ncbi:MAG TPA: peptidoglycan editing factor PgeF [Vicinamibacteria bacterium]|nr:peptidoglycan editing factor PgeF [Vicinamibacteria bacterium]